MRGYIVDGNPPIWHASAEYTTQQTDTELKAAPGAGNNLYLTDITIICNGSVTVTLEQGTTTLKFKHYADAQGSGVSTNFATPMRLAENTNLTVTTSGNVTVFVSVAGYTV